MKKSIYLLLLSLLIAQSCKFALLYKTQPTPSKGYITFYVSPNVFQYYIKPLKFKNQEFIVMIDFTLRDTCKSNCVTANYSLYSKDKKITHIDSAYFVVNNNKIFFKSPEKLFVEKNQIRISSTLNIEEFIDFVKYTPVITLFFENKQHTFVPTKKTKKVLKEFRTEVIDYLK